MNLDLKCNLCNHINPRHTTALDPDKFEDPKKCSLKKYIRCDECDAFLVFTVKYIKQKEEIIAIIDEEPEEYSFTPKSQGPRVLTARPKQKSYRSGRK